MKRVLVLALLSVASSFTPLQDPTVTVTGIVTDTSNGSPLASVQVRLVGPSTFSATTGTDGRFRLSAPPAEYGMSAQRPGFFGASVNGVPRMNVSRRLTLVAGQQPPEQILSLSPGGVITGRIFDASGSTPRSATIAAVQVRYEDGKPYLSYGLQAYTNEQGEFRIFWVPAGEYLVMYQETLGVSDPPTLVSANSSNIRVRTYYPGTARLDAAVPITVASGAEVRGVDFSLQTEPTFKVSGRVVHPDGPAGVSQNVSALPDFVLINSDFSAQEIFVSSRVNAAPQSERESGSFELRGIPPGSYDLYATIRTPTGAAAHSGSIPIVVTSQDLKDLVIPVHPPVDLAGRVIPTDGMKLPDNSKIAIRYIGSSTIGGIIEATVNPNGDFLFKGMRDGVYKVAAVTLPPDAFISELKHGERSIADDGLVRISRETPVPIHITLVARTGSISGSVVHPEGRKGVDTTVVLLPEGSRRANLLYHRTVQADASGTFTLDNIAPGAYRLFAWEGVFASAWQNAAFVAKYEDQGLAMNVTAGKADGIRVSVIWLK